MGTSWERNWEAWGHLPTPDRGPSVLLLQCSLALKEPPAPSTHHPRNWACLLQPRRLCPFWKALVTPTTSE